MDLKIISDKDYSLLIAKYPTIEQLTKKKLTKTYTIRYSEATLPELPTIRRDNGKTLRWFQRPLQWPTQVLPQS